MFWVGFVWVGFFFCEKLSLYLSPRELLLYRVGFQWQARDLEHLDKSGFGGIMVTVLVFVVILGVRSSVTYRWHCS
jgi:hypothetical protein